MAKYRPIGQRPKKEQIDKAKLIKEIKRTNPVRQLEQKSKNIKIFETIFNDFKEKIGKDFSTLTAKQALDYIRTTPDLQIELRRQYGIALRIAKLPVEEAKEFALRETIRELFGTMTTRQNNERYQKEQDVKAKQNFESLKEYLRPEDLKLILKWVFAKGYSPSDANSRLEFFNSFFKFKKEHGINQEIIKNNPCIYPGAGYDPHTPILLGARNIDLLDPTYQNQKDREIVFEELKRYGPVIKLSDYEYEFYKDFGNGPELVKVNLLPWDSYTFNTKRKYGMVLAFRSADAADGLNNSILMPKGYRILGNYDARKTGHGTLLTDPNKQGLSIFVNN